MRGGRRTQKRGGDPARLVADLHLASRLADEHRFEEAIPLLRRALTLHDTPALHVALGDCLRGLGLLDEARTEYQLLADQHPPAALRLGSMLMSEGQFAAAASYLRRCGLRDPHACLARAYVALQIEQWAEAEEAAAAALRTLPSDSPQRDEAALYLGLALAARGELARAAEAVSKLTTPNARALAARCHLFGGELRRALEGYAQLESEEQLPAEELGHAALAAAWSGEPERARALLVRARGEAPGLSTRLAEAQIALAGRDPDGALAALPAETEVIANPTDAIIAAVLRARARRQLGRASGLGREPPTFEPVVPSRVRALAWLEVGHTRADEGHYEDAEVAFTAAHQLDPSLTDAQRARELAAQRLTWKREVEAGAGRELESARAEMESMRATFAAREGEIAELRRQLARLESERRETEATLGAQLRPSPVAAPAASVRRELLSEELVAREAEVQAKTEDELTRAFGGRLREVPPALQEIVRQAERMFQKGLQTDLPGAGVAVLFSGALERALYVTIVSELDRSLDRHGTRAAFLAAAGQSTDRAGRVVYADRFVAAFDRERPQKAPGLGEVARVLRRRHESHLAVLKRFLEEERGWSTDFLDALGPYLEEVKVRLRDPVAHGRVLEISEREVSELRATLMHGFAGGAGVLHRLAFPR